MYPRNTCFIISCVTIVDEPKNDMAFVHLYHKYPKWFFVADVHNVLMFLKPKIFLDVSLSRIQCVQPFNWIIPSSFVTIVRKTYWLHLSIQGIELKDCSKRLNCMIIRYKVLQHGYTAFLSCKIHVMKVQMILPPNLIHLRHLLYRTHTLFSHLI